MGYCTSVIAERHYWTTVATTAFRRQPALHRQGWGTEALLWIQTLSLVCKVRDESVFACHQNLQLFYVKLVKQLHPLVIVVIYSSASTTSQCTRTGLLLAFFVLCASNNVFEYIYSMHPCSYQPLYYWWLFLQSLCELKSVAVDAFEPIQSKFTW